MRYFSRIGWIFGLSNFYWNTTVVIFKCIQFYEHNGILIQMWLKLISISLIENQSAAFQKMAYRLFYANPMSEPMMSQFADTQDVNR